MENIVAGTWLEATPLLQGTEFENAAVFIHQYDDNGVVGFVVNKVFDRRLNELAEFADGKPIALYDGGPVDREHLFVLHRRPELIGNSRHITGAVYYGGDFTKAVQLLNNGQISENDIRIFIGYCGWDKEQLEEEIREGSWRVGNSGRAELFKLAINN
jgi:putative transcriptional regulator